MGRKSCLIGNIISGNFDLVKRLSPLVVSRYVIVSYLNIVANYKSYNIFAFRKI